MQRDLSDVMPSRRRPPKGEFVRDIGDSRLHIGTMPGASAVPFFDDAQENVRIQGFRDQSLCSSAHENLQFLDALQ
jgi:hypothetical protein